MRTLKPAIRSADRTMMAVERLGVAMAKTVRTPGMMKVSVNMWSPIARDSAYPSPGE
jgi:hypothetical protein